MIKTAEQPGRAGAFAADRVAAMRAGVEECVHDPSVVAHEDQRAPADPSSDEVAGICDLRFMAGVEPAAIENLAALMLQDLGIGKNPAVDAKDAPHAIVNDQVLYRCHCHRHSSRSYTRALFNTNYSIATPPLAPRCWPVTNDASGEPKKATTAATSVGCAGRPMPTTRPAAILAISSKNAGSVQPGSRKPGGVGWCAPSASVSIAPGETQLTVMPWRMVSPANVIVSPTIDPLPMPASNVW